jgi:Tfp pilus assembly protein PilF
MIEELIKDYITYPDCTQNGNDRTEIMYRIARDYHKAGQTASATTFYFKVARDNKNELGYECLLQIGECFSQQGNREGTVRNMYHHALNLLPERPEAYILMSKNWQFNGDMQSAYTYIKQGLPKEFTKPLRTLKKYHNKSEYYMQMAHCAWHWGKPSEAREYYHKLENEDLTLEQKIDFKHITDLLQPDA